MALSKNIYMLLILRVGYGHLNSGRTEGLLKYKLRVEKEEKREKERVRMEKISVFFFYYFILIPQEKIEKPQYKINNI